MNYNNYVNFAIHKIPEQFLVSIRVIHKFDKKYYFQPKFVWCNSQQSYQTRLKTCDVHILIYKYINVYIYIYVYSVCICACPISELFCYCYLLPRNTHNDRYYTGRTPPLSSLTTHRCLQRVRNCAYIRSTTIIINNSLH